MIHCSGFMISGLYFEHDYCICIYHWPTCSSQLKQLSEIWLIEPNGKKICYISPKEGVSFFNNYHTFDEVTDAAIDISETNNTIKMSTCKNDNEIIRLDIHLKKTFNDVIANLFLTLNNKAFITEGKTETGKLYRNIPKRIITISHAQAFLNGKSLGKNIKPKREHTFEDGTISDKRIVNYCSHDIGE